MPRRVVFAALVVALFTPLISPAGLPADARAPIEAAANLGSQTIALTLPLVAGDTDVPQPAAIPVLWNHEFVERCSAASGGFLCVND
jgi:hypothetical protein